jgi:hypothetical protein
MDLATIDELLTTTRSVRQRLDLDRDVPLEVMRSCLRLALQAPTARTPSAGAGSWSTTSTAAVPWLICTARASAARAPILRNSARRCSDRPDSCGTICIAFRCWWCPASTRRAGRLGGDPRYARLSGVSCWRSAAAVWAPASQPAISGSARPRRGTRASAGRCPCLPASGRLPHGRAFLAGTAQVRR